MRRLAAACLSAVLVLSELVPLWASFTLRAAVDGDIAVSLEFGGLNSTVCERIGQHPGLINDTTFPRMIVEGLRGRGLNSVGYYDPRMDLDPSAGRLSATFHLHGWDVVSFTYNGTTTARVYRVGTEWRKVDVNITDPEGNPILLLGLTEALGEPLDRWQAVNYTPDGETRLAYYHNYTGPGDLDPQAYIILPAEARSPRVEGDTVIFEAPPAQGEVLLNSPFPVVGALIAASVVIVLSRRVRKVREAENS